MYNILVKKEKVGYSAKVDAVPVFTQGDTLDELLHNVQEAMQCYFEEEKKFQSNINNLTLVLRFSGKPNAINI